MSIFLRTAYNYDRDGVSTDSALHCLDASRTQQHNKAECDINEIVRRFGVTGQLPQGKRLPQYGDFTDIADYRSALQSVRDAAESFMDLPSDIRARFQNDPAQLLDFLAVEANRAEAESLGILEKSSLPSDLVTAPTPETPTPSDPITS